MLDFRKLYAFYTNGNLAVTHFHLSPRNQRDFLQKNKDVAENVSTYKSAKTQTLKNNEYHL